MNNTTLVPPSSLPHNYTPWGMFLAADVVVKSVMLGLALASLVTWTIWLAKCIEFRRGGRKLRAANARLGAAKGLADANSDGEGVIETLLRAARAEVGLSGSHAGEGLKERVAAQLNRVEAEAGEQLKRGTGVLATIGSVAPFVGLFGTVWGIMNSFIGISEAQTTNLAVVAPGIAEALQATAMGLFAAIPAVVVYNHFARAIAAHRRLVADAATDVLCLVSRDIDQRGA